MNLRNILSTTEQKNSETWNDNKVHMHGKHLKRVKGYDQHQKLELNPPEKKRMKNDERVEHLQENHRVRMLIEKNGETSHQ